MAFDPSATESRDFVRQLTNCQGPLLSFIVSLMPGHPDTSDVLQETNLTLWDKMGEFEPGTNFQAWAFTVARYKVLAHLKKCRNSKLILFEDSLLKKLCEAAADRDPQAYKIKARALEACMENLKPKDQELINARYVSNETIEHYAAKIGRSVNSLYVILGRLRTVLRNCVSARIKQEGSSA